MSGPPDPAILTNLDAIASALVERALPVTVRQTAGPADVAIAQRLRGAAILQRGWSGPETLIDGRDVDPDDDRAVHLLAVRGDRAVGACRLLYPEGATAPSEPVFLGRLTVIDPEHRAQGSVAGALIGRSWLEIRARGYSRIAGLTSAPMLRLLRRMGFGVRVVGPPIRHFREDRAPIVFGPSDGDALLR